MADHATTTSCAFWNMLAVRRQELIHSIENTPSDRDALEQQLAATEEVMLGEPAPDIAATLLKLELLWQGKLDGEHEDARRRQMILAELKSALAA